jgi:hypothetical protein
VQKNPNENADVPSKGSDDDSGNKAKCVRDHLHVPVVHCFAALQAGHGMIASPSPDSTLPLPSHLGQIAGFGVGAGSGAGVGAWMRACSRAVSQARSAVMLAVSGTPCTAIAKTNAPATSVAVLIAHPPASLAASVA